MEPWLRVSNQTQRVESRGDDKGGNEESVGLDPSPKQDYTCEVRFCLVLKLNS